LEGGRSIPAPGRRADAAPDYLPFLHAHTFTDGYTDPNIHTHANTYADNDTFPDTDSGSDCNPITISCPSLWMIVHPDLQEEPL
jgi:hypothetical protein